MDCVCCGLAAVTERPECTAQGYRRFRCRECGKQFNARSAGLLNRTQYPSDIIALVVLWRLRYKLSLRDLTEMFLIRGRDRPERGGRELDGAFCSGHGRKGAKSNPADPGHRDDIVP